MTTNERIRAIVASSSGNLVEWYDFYTYAFTAIYFAHAFCVGDTTTELLQAGGDLRGRLPDAADRQLVFRPLRRQARPERSRWCLRYFLCAQGRS